MTVIGALAAGVAVTCVTLALRSSSHVERRLRWLGARPKETRLGVHLADQLTLAKIAASLAAVLAGCVVASIWSLGLVPVIVAAYVGFILPSVVVERREARYRRDAERAVVTLVEWLHALVACGRPIETAIAGLAARGSGSSLLDGCLERIRRDYTLGVPLRDALAREGGLSGVRGLVDLADRLDRARDLGRAVLPVLQDLRDELRAAERARGLQAASHVEGKLTLVLTLCYLPALALLVIIPLFLTILAGLFA